MKSLKNLIAGFTAAIALLICTQSFGLPILVHAQHIDANGRAIENPWGSVCGASLNHLHNQNFVERLYYTPGYNPIFAAGIGAGQTFSLERVLDLAPGAYSIKGGTIVGGPPPFETPFTVAADGSVSPNVFRGTITGQGYGPGCIPNTPDVLTRFVLTLTGNSGGGPAGATGAAGAQGPQGKQGADGAAGATGTDGDAGAAGADAPCTPCDDVANAAVDLACTILSEALPTSSQELTDAATVIVNSLMISTNICEPACDIGAGIQAAIDVKLNQ